MADATYGFFWGGIGPSAIDHVAVLQSVNISNSLLVGRSRSNAACVQQRGLLLFQFATEGYSISPSTCGPLGGHWLKGTYGIESPSGSNAALAAEVHISGCTIVRFGVEDCSASSFLMETTMKGGVSVDSADAVPPFFFSRITTDESTRHNLAYLPKPKQEWIDETKCVVMDCDGPKHVVILDLDGSLTGMGPNSSILARAYACPSPSPSFYPSAFPFLATSPPPPLTRPPHPLLFVAPFWSRSPAHALSPSLPHPPLPPLPLNRAGSEFMHERRKDQSK